jgi:hypothetical protein
MKTKSKDSGKLRIGDDWSAIRIIALSQSQSLESDRGVRGEQYRCTRKDHHDHAGQGAQRALSIHPAKWLGNAEGIRGRAVQWAPRRRLLQID